ncbi:MAG TPA: hypothetical protein VFK04_15985 [Gemmatimonadaceae bacterium]|nr:hypothetical protein [Gemmatimonadaceae bacterium]
MPPLHRLTPPFSALSLILPLAFCTGTPAPSSDSLHSHVVTVLGSVALTPLPAGDTLISWNGGRPVLIHTGHRDSAGVSAGMLRFDRMEGIANVRWDAHSHSPTSFDVRWLTPKQNAVDSLIISGVATSDQLQLTRSGMEDTSLVLPELPWAVADYGMEELLLPLFDGPPHATAQKVAVFRPFGLKWDTLSLVTSAPDSTWMVATWTEGEPEEQWRAAVLDGRHLLWLRRSLHPDDEKRPLEQTPLGREFERLHSVLAPATVPRAPQK